MSPLACIGDPSSDSMSRFDKVCGDIDGIADPSAAYAGVVGETTGAGGGSGSSTGGVGGSGGGGGTVGGTPTSLLRRFAIITLKSWTT
jgi:hypothetical protein